MRYWTIMLCMFVCFSACKKKLSTDSSAEGNTVVLSQDDESDRNSDTDDKVKDCEDFVDQYEAWSEEYIAFMAKYKDDPVKAVTSPEYSEMMLKASSWSQEWLSISVSCAQNSKYQERVEEISDRMEAKLEELGFN